ncbi:hypothetical protein KDD17_11505 [Sulfitobacter albidus]|uniref:Lipoprotein n=1 Tax=Sulfitobacter albidus TaxID=2829501 RepID=A0A975JBS7_9RHOB|nr:hypothetical protein [Sulfitobacter albidus]QUJ75584.1 hypothetical protein KDD17_11505 [Sulfitobacter albidus]
MKYTSIALALGLALLAGCAEKGKESPPEAIEAAIYPYSGQPKLTLFTMVNNRTGAGAHTALMVQHGQSVLFDPAGSFEHERLPERGDVIYGMSPSWVRSYKSAHAREAFHVVTQEINVTPAQAQRAMQLVQSNGAVPSAMCASATSGILRQIPGFEGIRQGFYPLKLMEQVEAIPGVTTDRYYENDSGDVRDGVRALTQ